MSQQQQHQQLIEKLDEYEGNQGYFLKIFFISQKMNKNIWKVTASSIPDGLKTGLEKRFFGKTAPIILREDWEQAPKLGHPSPYVDDMVAEQEPDRVGDFIAVGQKEDGTGWCIVRIDDEKAQNLHRTGQIKFVSPSIESIKENARGEDIAWRINHLGFVDDPAYDYEAQVTGFCSGNQGECIVHLSKQASSRNKKIKCKLEIPETPCQMKKPLGHRQASVLLHRKDIPLKQAVKDKEEDGQWVTSNGQHIFIPSGQDKGEAVKEHFKKLEDKNDKLREYQKLQKYHKEKKQKENETTDNKKDIIDDDDGRIKISINTNVTTKNQVSLITNIWNNIPTDEKKHVFNLNVGNPPLGHEKAAGNYTQDTNTLTISMKNFPEGADKETINTVIQHELAHAELLGTERRERNKIINTFGDALPVDSYTKQFHVNVQDAEKEWLEAAEKRTRIANEMYELRKSGEELDMDSPQRIELVKKYKQWNNHDRKILISNETKAIRKYHKIKTVYGLENHAAYTLMKKGVQPNHEQFPENYLKLRDVLKDG